MTSRVKRVLAPLAAVWLAVMAAAPAAIGAAPALPSQDPFYAPPAGFATTAPGTVLRTRTVQIAESGSTTPVQATQVLYRTTGELGQPTATVATVLAPAVTAGVRKLVSYQTAYDALGSECDPSYTLQGGNSSYSTAQDEEQIILGYVNAGYTVVVPDYEGEALDWAAGQESGYGTLDGIRATEHALGLDPASTPVGIVGYSGGSIATEFASELAPSYAPELDLVGAAEGGVPVDFFHNLAYINGSPSWSGVIPAVLVSLARAFHVSFQSYLSPYGKQVTQQVADQCINSFLGAYPGLTYQALLAPPHQNIYGIPEVVRIGDELIMSRTGTPKGPLFIGVGNADGTGDGVMVAADDEALAHTYCTRGVAVQFTEYSGQDHTHAAVPFEQGAFTFLTARLNGQSVPDGCSQIAAGNSLAPLPVPGSSPPPRAKPIAVHLRDLGSRARRHGLLVELWTSRSSLSGIVVTLRRGGRVLETLRLRRLGTHPHALVLRVRGRMPADGRYVLTVARGRRRLLTRRLIVR